MQTGFCQESYDNVRLRQYKQLHFNASGGGGGKGVSWTLMKKGS